MVDSSQLCLWYIGQLVGLSMVSFLVAPSVESLIGDKSVIQLVGPSVCLLVGFLVCPLVVQSLCWPVCSRFVGPLTHWLEVHFLVDPSVPQAISTCQLVYIGQSCHSGCIWSSVGSLIGLFLRSVCHSVAGSVWSVI